MFYNQKVTQYAFYRHNITYIGTFVILYAAFLMLTQVHIIFIKNYKKNVYFILLSSINKQLFIICFVNNVLTLFIVFLYPREKLKIGYLSLLIISIIIFLLTADLIRVLYFALWHLIPYLVFKCSQPLLCFDFCTRFNVDKFIMALIYDIYNFKCIDLNTYQLLHIILNYHWE